MSTPSFPDTSLRPPEQVRFFTRHYHLLKGLCYAPAGGLLLAVILGMLLVRPAWMAVDALPHLTALGLVVATAPWMWYMHRRYEATYGRVRQEDGDSGGLIGQPSPSFLSFGGLLLFGLCWLAVAIMYVPHHTPVEDNHYPVVLVGWLLLLGGLHAPVPRLRWIYGLSGAFLFGATFLPLVLKNVVLVQALNYGLLGAVVAGVGVYNHRLLVNTLGPMGAEEGADE